MSDPHIVSKSRTTETIKKTTFLVSLILALLRNELCHIGIRCGDPSARSNAVGLVVELLGIESEEVFEDRTLHDLRMDRSNT
jgi:hypothetical protein